MTRVEWDHKGDEFIIEAEGHSGYAIPGKDIVCAGISTLLQALIIHTPKHDILHKIVQDGYISIHVAGHDACTCSEMVVTGLKAIESQYGDNLKVIKGDLLRKPKG